MFRNRTFRPKLLSRSTVMERSLLQLSNGLAVSYVDPNSDTLPDTSDYNLKSLLQSGQNLEYVNPTVTASNSDIHLSETASSMINNVSQNNNANENGNT